jgi:hypothetical protein
MRNASPDEQHYLEDGILTASEVEESILEVTSCASAAGLEVSAVTQDRRGRFTFGAQWTAAIGPSGYSALEECRRRYYSEVDRLWALHTAPSEEELQSARASIARCLRDAGTPAPEHPSAAELMQLSGGASGSMPQAYRDCATKIQTEFDLPGFIG